MDTGFGSWLVVHLDGEGDGKMTKKADDNIKKWERIQQAQKMEEEFREMIEKMDRSPRVKKQGKLKRKKKK